jgi:hypothetical protein
MLVIIEISLFFIAVANRERIVQQNPRGVRLRLQPDAGEILTFPLLVSLISGPLSPFREDLIPPMSR